MRLTRQKRVSGEVKLDMAAMVDVVMLLLIFFMCTTTFREVEQGIDAQVAQLSDGAGEVVIDLEPIEIELADTPDGVVVRCDGSVCESFDKLGLMLRQRRAIADVDVIVRGGGGVPFWYMVAAVDECYGADLMRVAYSTRGAVN